MLPSALEASRRTTTKPSKLLISIADGAMLGRSHLFNHSQHHQRFIAIGEPTQAPLDFFDFAPVGCMVAIAGIVFITLFGKYLLPDHEPLPLRSTPKITN